VDEEALVRGFTEHEVQVLEDAVAELEAENLVSCTHSISHTFPHMRPMMDLYATFDPIAFGHDPTADAAELAKKVLDLDESVDVGALHQGTGWERRRFNPAITLVIAQVDGRRVSGELNSDYPSRWFGLMAEDRVSLKRFIARMGQ
jgi:hypothetical protein